MKYKRKFGHLLLKSATNFKTFKIYIYIYIYIKELEDLEPTNYKKKKTVTTQQRDIRERYFQKNNSQLQSLKSGIQIQIMQKINPKTRMLKLPKIKDQIQS